MARCPAAWPHSHTARGLTTTPLAQPSSVAAVANGTRPPRHSPGAGAHHWSADEGAIPERMPLGSRILGDTVDPAPPPERSNEADDLALHQAFTAQACPAQGSGATTSATSAFGQHSFDQVSGGLRATPRPPGSALECMGLFNRTEQALHAGIIIAYAVG